MVTASGSMRWWTVSNPTAGFHKKHGFCSLCLNLDTGAYYVCFQQQSGGLPLKIDLPPVSFWKKPTSVKFAKETCKLRSVLLSFNEGSGALTRVQLSFPVEINIYGVVIKDHGKLIHLTMMRAYNDDEEW